MARFLFKVTDSFVVRHYLVLLPGIVPQGEECFRVGDSIELRRPDGTSRTVEIAGLEMLNPMPADYPVVPALTGVK